MENTGMYKALADIAAVGAGLGAFFQVIPWGEIAGFMSVCYLAFKFAVWVAKKI